MASPSHSQKDSYNCPSSEDKQWLELGLGLGFRIACRKQEEEDEEEEEEYEEDQELQPNPNISFPVSASGSSQLLQAKQKPKPPGCSNSSSTGLELGLSLGLDSGSRAAPGWALERGEDDDDREHGVTKRFIDVAAPPGGDGNYDHHQILWPNQDGDHYYGDIDDDDYDDMAWWPCNLNSGTFLGLNNWQMPVPNNSHDYLTRTTRPHSGLWFTLQSYTNRDGEALPQIPKAYIRVKDENVTIFMVKKYLVRKLGLSNDTEVEISCMGQRLLHTQTLKQVRDCVWLPRFVESESFLNYSHQSNCVNNHLMSLYYGRRCAFN